MPLELAYPEPSHVRDNIDSQAVNNAKALQSDQAARTVPVIVSAATPEFISRPLTRHYPRSVAAPCVGELHLWRFRCEWLPVPVQEGEVWLSKVERERARLHPNSALRKRFVSARVVTRWIVANLFDCDPRTVDLQDDGNEKLHARHPHDGRGITIDIAYGGIWIVIGIASAALGLSVVVPPPVAVPDDASDGSRQRARYDSLCNALRYAPVDIDPDLLSSNATACAFDLAGHGCWHVLDLPMSGKIRAAVALAQPVTHVHAFGWPKSCVFGKSNT
jgi:hypothetical protein